MREKTYRSNMALEQDQEFDNFQEFKATLDQYGKENNVQFVLADSKSIIQALLESCIQPNGKQMHNSHSYGLFNVFYSQPVVLSCI